MAHLHGWNKSLTRWVKLSADNATDVLTTIDYEHHEIHSGSHYFSMFHVDVPADDVLDVRFTTPNTTKWLHFLGQYITEAEFLLDFYEGVTINAAGTSLTAFNSNRNSAKTSGITDFSYIINTNVANANVDTAIASATILAEVQTGSGRSTGGAFARGSEIILKQNTSYSFRFANQSNATKYVNWEFEWYEHTDKH